MLQTRVCLACCLALAAVLVVGPVAQAAPSRDAAASRAMVHHINDVRAAHGLHRLKSSRRLRRGATRHSRRMMRYDIFVHATLRLTPPFRRLSEVIALRRGLRGTIRKTVRRWLSSPPHRAIVLSSAYRYVGAGRARGRYRGRRATSWTARLAR
jgi:uncharacterized protein YkwD